MTISSFCHEQLRERGPLPLDVLTDLAVTAGVTTARHPESSVRSSIAYNAVQLPDGRWASPAQLLEGRWLTTRGLADCDYDDSPRHAQQDLAPLHFLRRSQSIPLATGEVLRQRSYSYEWELRREWAALTGSGSRLVGLQLKGGVLHVEALDEDRSIRDAGQALALAVGKLDEPRHWSAAVHAVEETLLSRLWELLATGSDVLSRPTPPLSDCVPALATALREEFQARAEAARHWRPQLDLPVELERIAINGAHTEGLLLPEWLNSFVANALRAHDTAADRDHWSDDRVRPLRRGY